MRHLHWYPFIEVLNHTSQYVLSVLSLSKPAKEMSTMIQCIARSYAPMWLARVHNKRVALRVLGVPPQSAHERDALRRWHAHVALAMQDQYRGLHVLNVSDGASPQVIRVRVRARPRRWCPRRTSAQIRLRDVSL